MQFRLAMRSSLFIFWLAALLAPVGVCQSAPADQTSTQSSQDLPAAPPANPAPATRSQALPPAPAAPAVNEANLFPPPNPRNFTADSPTPETVDGFLKASFGFDPNRIWKVEDVLKTPVPGVSKVIVYLAEKGQNKVQPAVFFVLPDGKHLVAGDEILPFGVRPFEADRQLLASEANGPWQGAPSKGLEIVEFADFECPHCKEAQDTMRKLLNDYSAAHIVFQNYPIVSIHPEAFKAAAYGDCVAKLSGNQAFFKFADAIFASQAALTPQSSDQALQDAVTKAGGDPGKVSACAASANTKAAVNASIDLGNRVGVEGTPSLYVNGRSLQSGPNSFLGLPYDVLRNIIDYQAQADGIKVPPTPPPGPTLQ